MVATPESKVKKDVKKDLTDLKLYYQMPVTGGFGNSGDPDFTVCVAGLTVGLETKDDCLRHRRGDLYRGKRIKTGAPTDLQKLRMAEIRDSGGITLVVDRHNVVVLRAWLEYVLQLATSDRPFRQVLLLAKTAARNNDLWYEVMPDYD